MLLTVRIDELSEGERVALARRASRGVIGALIATGVGRELKSLLGNPRLIEADAVRIATRASAPPEALAHLATHARWGSRRPVRRALAANPRTPPAAALGVLRWLPSSDLLRLSRDVAVPQLVRVGAERLLRSSGKVPGPSGGKRY